MTVNRKFYIWGLIILFLLGIVALALWLDLRHQAPSFTIVDVSVPTSNGRSPQHTDIYIALDVNNPNNAYSITYDYSLLTVKYAQRTLGETDIVINHQPKNKKTSVTCQVIVDDQQQDVLVKAISKTSGEAMLMVELKTGIRYHNLGRTSKQYDLKYQGQFKIGSDGKILGKKKKVKLVKSHAK